MKYYYDLHLHSCLSPCGDLDMTPNNIVNMAKLLGLETDHNTSRNCEAAMAVGREIGLLVIPGMEMTTSEDIHAVCLFPDLEKALAWSDYVDAHRIKVKNRVNIYGEQIMHAYAKVKEFGGICYPAHIDRDSLSILSVLGEIDESCGFKTAELADISKLDELKKHHPILDTLHIITCSDAHYLENMRGAENTLELEELTAECVLAKLDA